MIVILKEMEKLKDSKMSLWFLNSYSRWASKTMTMKWVSHWI